MLNKLWCVQQSDFPRKSIIHHQQLISTVDIVFVYQVMCHENVKDANCPTMHRAAIRKLVYRRNCSENSKETVDRLPKYRSK